MVDDERAWELAEEFERLARTTEAGPSRELTAAVADSADAEMHSALLMALQMLGDEDHEAARRYAQHLVRLADLLPDLERRYLLTGIDLILATVSAYAQEWEDATLRAIRAGPGIHELLPGAVADWMWVSGGCAEHDGRLGDARELWTQARHLFATDERWFEAARASAALAVLGGQDDHVDSARDTAEGSTIERALADWTEGADLYVAAGEPDLARECATEAAGLVMRTIRNMWTGAESRAYALASAARELALRHGDVESAAELACFVGLTGPDAGRTLEEARTMFAAARDDYRSLRTDPRQTRIQLAWIDLSEARTLMARGRFREAEPLLHTAIRTYRAEDMTEAMTMCETMLTGLVSFTEQDLERVQRVVTKQEWADEESLSAAALIRALAFTRDGRVAEALAKFTEASRLAVAARVPHKAVGFNGMAAMIALAYGDRGPAEHSVAEIERYLAENLATMPADARQLLSYLQLLLQAELAARDGDQDAQLTHLRNLEEQLLSFGAGLVAALIALRRARALLDRGDYPEALCTALPAALALDAVRFTLPDAERRSRWISAVAGGFDTAFRSAATCADARLIAELMEVARGNAVPLARSVGDAAGDITESLGDLLAEAGPYDGRRAGEAMPPGTLPGAEALAGGENRTALGLPAYLRTPWDTIALAEYLQCARRYHDPIRANIAVDWIIALPAAERRRTDSASPTPG